jgi:hypothetical protein
LYALNAFQQNKEPSFTSNNLYESIFNLFGTLEKLITLDTSDKKKLPFENSQLLESQQINFVLSLYLPSEFPNSSPKLIILKLTYFLE